MWGLRAPQVNGCRGSRWILQEHLCPGGSGPVFPAQGGARTQIPQDMFEFSPRSNRTTSFSHVVKLRTLLLPSPCSSLPALAECHSPGSFSRASFLPERALHSSKEGFGNTGAPSPKGPHHSLPSLRGRAKFCNTPCTASIGIIYFPCKWEYSPHNPQLKAGKGTDGCGAVFGWILQALHFGFVLDHTNTLAVSQKRTLFFMGKTEREKEGSGLGMRREEN